MRVAFGYMGLRVHAEVEEADHDALIVGEWTAYLEHETGIPCADVELPGALHAFLNENEQFMSGLRQRAVEEAR